MSDRWEPPEHVEPFPDRSAELRAALERLAEAKRQFAVSRRQAEVPMLLHHLGLIDWDAEMDNCYPGFDA